MTGRRHCKALLVNGIFGHTCSHRKKKTHHLCGRLPGRSHERREAAVEPRFLTAPRPLPHGLITAKNTILPLRHQGKKKPGFPPRLQTQDRTSILTAPRRGKAAWKSSPCQSIEESQRLLVWRNTFRSGKPKNVADQKTTTTKTKQLWVHLLILGVVWKLSALLGVVTGRFLPQRWWPFFTAGLRMS